MSTLLTEALEMYYTENPDAKAIPHWSGCNYYIGQGNSEFTPVGTAQSVHDCMDCELISSCKMKQSTPIWLHDDEIKKKLDKEFEEMRSNPDYKGLL